MAPIKVYGWAVSPWMSRTLVCLEEANAEYEIVPMSRSGGDHLLPDYLAINVRIPHPNPAYLLLSRFGNSVLRRSGKG